MQRRTFLLSLAAATASAGPRYRPKISAQCYVWTQDFQARKESLLDGMPRMFEETRAAGYKRIELMAGFFTPENRARTYELVKQHRFEIPVVYSGARLYDGDAAVEKVLELAELVKPTGCRILNVNPDPKAQQALKTLEELDRQAQGVERLRAGLEKSGMRLVLHHHAPEMKENAREWYHLLKNTSAGICIDVDWVYQGSQDPMALLKAAGSRLGTMHLRNAKAGVWTESVDEGDYNYEPVYRHLKEIGFDGYLMVELAWNPKMVKTRSLMENLKRSREWAERTFKV